MLGLVALFSACSQYKVYSVKDSPSLPVGGGILYALPKTQLCVEVTVQRRDLSQAPYSQYAADYLGVEIRFTETEWSSIFAALDAGQIDIVANGVSYLLTWR